MMCVNDIWAMVKEGKTLDVNAVEDEETRGVICGYLRSGWANLEDKESTEEWHQKKCSVDPNIGGSTWGCSIYAPMLT
jgi:hypothetical protein